MKTETLVLDGRRQATERKLTEFRDALAAEIPRHEFHELFGDHTCLYAVGSAGRMEVSAHSDLDLFLVRTPRRAPCRIDEVRIQSAIVRVHRALALPEPSNDAIFLRMHTSTDLVERLGEPSDDTENTFTARMLLLLESKPILGQEVYDEVIRQAVSAYWTNLQYHAADYLPFLLLNDVVRYWRNLLLNYEHKTAKKQRELDKARPELTPDEAEYQRRRLDADKWLRSIKLRFSRCLTCYGTVAWLLGEARRTGNVTREAFHDATRLTPIERLESAARATSAEANEQYIDLARSYERCLVALDLPKQELLDRFSERDFRRSMRDAAESFGEQMFEILKTLGHNQRLYRYLVI